MSKVKLSSVANGVVSFFWDIQRLSEPEPEFVGEHYKGFKEALKEAKEDGDYEVCLFMEYENGDFETPLGVKIRKEGDSIIYL